MNPHSDEIRVRRPEFEEGHLHWSGCDLTEVAKAFGTPLHVGCTGAVTDSIRRFRAPFRARNVSLQIRYSVKTNPLPFFLFLLGTHDVGFEVIAEHECQLLRALHQLDKNVVATGFREGLPLAGTDGDPPFQMVTLTTPRQVERIRKCGASSASRIPVALHVNPQFWRGTWDLTLNTSRRGGPLGVHPDSPAFHDALDTIGDAPHLALRGFHMHLGSGIRSSEPYRRGLQMLEKSMVRASEAGHSVEVLNIGGGFGLPTAPVLKIRNILSSFFGVDNLFSPLSGLIETFSPSHDSTSLLAEVAEAAERTLNRLDREGLRPQTLLAEPGRVLSGPCQVLLLTVEEVVQKGTQNYLLCDGGAMALSPMLVTEEHRVLPLRQSEGERKRYDVLGHLPTSTDRVASNVSLPEMVAGDRIAVLDTGAYFLSLNNTFNGPRPPVAWIENGRVRLARRREATSELIARDRLPEFLPSNGNKGTSSAV